MRRNYKLLHTLVICALLFGAFSPAVVLADPTPPTPGNDTIVGDQNNAGVDFSTLNNGDQTFSGGGGNDTLIGDNRSVTAFVAVINNGDDTLHGNTGNDTLIGDTRTVLGMLFEINNGDDILYGGSGNDTLYGDSLTRIPRRINFATIFTLEG
ncbi:MAG: hypothetical protein JEZ00_18065 [Anaerolineaceae bacterium]|nr:hypothetical protein [Anaerolineaceae bacterium]